METQHTKMVISFMRRNRAALLATVTLDGKPHCSVVTCIIHDNFDIYFTTRAEGRKYESLLVNSEVSMLFTSNGSMRQLQISGKAKKINGKKRQLELLDELMQRRFRNRTLPKPLSNFLKPTIHHAEHAIFRIRPYQMTYADFGTGEPGVLKADFKKIL